MHDRYFSNEEVSNEKYDIDIQYRIGKRHKKMDNSGFDNNIENNRAFDPPSGSTPNSGRGFDPRSIADVASNPSTIIGFPGFSSTCPNADGSGNSVGGESASGKRVSWQNQGGASASSVCSGMTSDAVYHYRNDDGFSEFSGPNSSPSSNSSSLASSPMTASTTYSDYQQHLLAQQQQQQQEDIGKFFVSWGVV